MRNLAAILLMIGPLVSWSQQTKIPRDQIKLNTKVKPHTVFGDFDGDGKKDTASLVYDTKHNFGLEISFGNLKKRYFGLAGDQELNLGNLDWVGEFAAVRKGTLVWDNVDDEGEIIAEEEVPRSKKIRLPNDGIFMHASEACGGGILYFEKQKAKWVIRE